MGVDKKFSDLKTQIDIQFYRKLIKSDKQFDRLESHLKTKNYFDFVNGFESLLLKNKNKKDDGYNRGTSLGDLERLYSFDLNLSKELYASIKEFEVKLKTSISYHFASEYCNTIPNTLNYLLPSYYEKPHPNTYDSKYLIKKYSSFVLFDNFSNTGASDFKNYAEYKKESISYLSHYNHPPFWVIIKQLNFNQIYILLGIQKPQIMNKILNDFNLEKNDRDYLLACTKLFLDLRNHCAHYELASRYQSKIANYFIIKKKLPCVTIMKIRPNLGRLSLFDALYVLSRFTQTSQTYNVIKKYLVINLLIGKWLLNKKLLSRMGNQNFKDWKFLLNNN